MAKIGGIKPKSAQCGKVNSLRLFNSCEIDEENYNLLRKKAIITNIVTNENYVMKLSSKDSKYFAYPFATYMRVKERYINIDNQQSSFVLEYYNGQKIVRTQFSDSVLNTKEIKALLSYGVIFDETSSTDLIKYLMISKSQAPITNVYHRLGWNNTPDENTFKGYKIFSDNPESINGKYVGSIDLAPKGDLKKWTAMVSKHVQGNTSMELALVLGFASPVLSLINDIIDIGSLVFNFCCTSSKGKTTAAMLAASVSSNPAVNRGTLITYNATENAILETISCLNNLTVGLDEVGMNSVTSFSRLLYSLASGTSKKRLNGDSTLKEDKHFCSIVLSTAEYNLLTDKTPDGVKTRVFELNDQFSTSAENSNAIKKVVMSNYGLAGEKFIKFIVDNMEHDKSDLLDIYYDYENMLSEMTTEYESNLRSRVISKLAVILTTAAILNEANILEQPLDMSRMAEYLADIVSNCCSYETSDERLLNIVAEEIIKNQHHFFGNEETLFSTCWGSVVEKDNYIIAKIFQNKFEDLMLQKGVINYTQSLKLLKDKGHLICETDRLTKRIKNKKGVKIPCYCLVIPKAVTKKH